MSLFVINKMKRWHLQSEIIRNAKGIVTQSSLCPSVLVKLTNQRSSLISHERVSARWPIKCIWTQGWLYEDTLMHQPLLNDALTFQAASQLKIYKK